MYKQLFINPLHAIVILATLIISGCGYQLQQPLLAEATLQPIYIDAQTQWKVSLTRQLMANNITVTKNRNIAGSVITLQQVDRSNRSLSVSAEGRDAERLRSVNVQLAWISKQQTLIAPVILSAEREQLTNPEQRAAQQRESELVDNELTQMITTKTLQLIRYAQHSESNKAALSSQ